MLKLLLKFLFSSFLTLTFLQYQQFTHLKGRITGTNIKVLGNQGEYDQANTIKGLGFSTSFLINNNSEILFFFGKTFGYNDINYASNRVWKFSLQSHNWMFLKGNENDDVFSTFQELNTFEESNEIGSRFSSKGWQESEEIFAFFGGAVMDKYWSYSPSKEFWRYNHSAKAFSALQSFNYEDSGSEYIGLFDDTEIPAARLYHETVKINDKEVLMLGGNGNIDGNSGFADYWIFNFESMQWQIKGGASSEGTTMIDYYDKDNSFGIKHSFSVTKINEHEVLVFGGYIPNGSYYLSNIVQKYNFTSNMWKYVSGEITNPSYKLYGSSYLRKFDPSNSIGARRGHTMIKINDNELLTFGGEGYGYQVNSAVSQGYLIEEWRFNTENNLWKFSGKEITKYMVDTYKNQGTTNLFSDNVIPGGIKAFCTEFVPENNEIIVIGGWGKSLTDEGALDDVFSLYLGNYCFQIKDTEPNVCAGKGKCTGLDTCECEDGFFGENCQLTKCNDVLSNETVVCLGKGICVNSVCLCYTQSIYNNLDCSINEEQLRIDEEYEQLMNNLWIYILIPVSIFIVSILAIIVCFVVVCLCVRLRKIIKKFDGIEDVDLILEEAKLEQNSTTPKIKIDKSLFEVEFKDLKLISILGEGGSQSIVYLAEWKGNFVAYKSIKACIGSNNDIFREFEKEVQIFSGIHHPSILGFYGACINPPKAVGIVLEFCKFGDIPSFFNSLRLKNKVYPIHEKIRLIKEIASGMSYLHSKKIIHRDLKPENVLVDDHEHMKIMDFGLSRLTSNFEKTMTKQIGTSYYMAPEVFKQEGKYSTKCDVYSFAILTYVVITENFFPYGIDTNGSKILQNVSTSQQFRPKIEEKEFKGCEFLIPLIKKNWGSNPSGRNSFEELFILLKNQEEIQIESKNKENVKGQ